MDYLMKNYEMSAEDIVKKVMTVLSRKQAR